MLHNKKKALKKYVAGFMFFVVFCYMFTGCGYSSDEIESLFSDETPDRLNLYRKNCFAVIDHVVVYLASSVDKIYIQNLDTKEVREDTLPEGHYCTEVISSDSYFYVMTNYSADNIVNDCDGLSLIRTYDKAGTFLEELEVPFKRIGVRNGMLFGLYDKEAFFKPWGVVSDNYELESNCYIEATHYIKESTFWKTKPKDLTGWIEITGESPTIKGTTLYKETEYQDDYHKTAYYRSEKKLPVMSELWYVRYVGDDFSSDAVKEKKESFIENRLPVLKSYMHTYTGNFSIDTNEIDNRIYGICRVYGENKMLHACTQNLQYSFTFTYEEDTQRIVKQEEFDGKELLYADADWLVYDTIDGIYYMDTATRTVHLAHKKDAQLAAQEYYSNLVLYVMDDTLRIGKENPVFIRMTDSE